MKASIKFREDQKPLLRAKIPLSILGLPFQSGVVAGESKELTLNLGTFFESGPAVKIAYRPNDSWNPFSLVVKTGIGHFGSPVSSSMLMSAEFNLLGRGNPSFMLHFKPQFGDFSIRKSQSSVFDKIMKSRNGVVSDDDSSIDMVDPPVDFPGFIARAGSFASKKINVLTPESMAASTVSAMFSGMEVAARTTVPVRERALMNFRWGVRVPVEIGGDANPTARMTFQKIPFLVMNKIGIEFVDCRDSKASRNTTPELAVAGYRDSDIADSCFTVKRHLELIQSENNLLKRAIEDLRQEIGGAKLQQGMKVSNSGKYRESERRNNEKRGSEINAYGGKPVDENVGEELKKALIGAS